MRMAEYKKDVLAREASGTTGLGDGIATPHAKSKGVKAAGLSAMTVPAGMDFESMDGKPSRLFFQIAAPDSANDEHMAILSKLATMIMDADFKEALIAAKSKVQGRVPEAHRRQGRRQVRGCRSWSGGGSSQG